MAVTIELDQHTRSEQLARVRPWLATTSLLQRALGRQLAALVGVVREEHLRGLVEGALEVARQDEQQLPRLHEAFGRSPGRYDVLTPAAAAGLSAARAAVGHLEGVLGGGRSASWRRLRVVMLTNVDALGAWGVCETLGLALGLPAAVEVAHPVSVHRSRAHAFLQELFLETCANALLHHREL